MDSRLGERYDARLASASEGWAQLNFDDAAWAKAVAVPAPAGVLVAEGARRHGFFFAAVWL